jgi:UDP-glucose 4-epimerase|tara:strand:+ start:8254 stop:9282 length:1029 start_codon:yes stop_codon:yes gene_type:complete
MVDKKYILVTGGAGFIGSHTVVSLREQGFEPIIVDDLRNAKPFILENLKTILGKAVLHFPIDCCNQTDLETIFKDYPIAGIIHFAAYKSVDESIKQPLKYYHNNLASLVNALELANKYDVNNIIFSSSCTVYGEPKDTIVVDENSPIQEATSPYGQTKIIGEKILRDFQRANPAMRITALRYFNPIGAHKSALIGELPIGRPANLLPFITQTAIGKLEKLTVYGNDYSTNDGSCIRDYIHVEDLAEAHVKALQHSIAAQNGFVDAINIGTGQGTSVLELISVFEKVTNNKLNYSVGPRRIGDVPAIFANASKAKSILNWEAKRTLEDSVRSAWKWEQYNSSL